MALEVLPDLGEDADKVRLVGRGREPAQAYGQVAQQGVEEELGDGGVLGAVAPCGLGGDHRPGGHRPGAHNDNTRWTVAERVGRFLVPFPHSPHT